MKNTLSRIEKAFDKKFYYVPKNDKEATYCSAFSRNAVTKFYRHQILALLKEKEEKEICICAAIKTLTGFVIKGHRHSDCFRTASSIKALTEFDISHSEQGFITSKNRFVDRKEAMKLQKEAGLMSNRKLSNNELFSEDLY